MLLQSNIYTKKAEQKVRADKRLRVCALLVICTGATSLHLCCMINALVFSQPEAGTFFIYIVRAQYYNH